MPKFAITATRVEKLYAEITAISREEAVKVADMMSQSDFTFDGGEFTVDYVIPIDNEHRFERIRIRYLDTDDTVEVIVSVGGDIEALQKQGLDEHVFYYFEGEQELMDSFYEDWQGEQGDFYTLEILDGSEDLNA